MGRSSLLGAEPAAVEPEGRDIAALGPSDSSDSGSDVAGLDAWFGGADPTEPIGVALRENWRRSAGADAGPREAPDISVDQVFDLSDPAGVPSTVDLEQVDEAAAADPEVGEEGEEEDESADPVGDGHSDAEAAQREARGRPPGRGPRSGRKP